MRRRASFHVPGEPQAWKRVARGRHGKSHVPEETKVAKVEVARCFQAENTGHDLITGPVEVRMDFVTNSEAKDWDNLAKLVCDALNRVAWNDDRQIWHAEVWVRRNDPHIQPGTYVVIDWEERREAT